MPHFGRLRIDAIDHKRVSAWFDAASVDKPGAANRALENLRAMLKSARQWGDLGEYVPDACANIVRNPRRSVARYLDSSELERLGAVLDRHQEEHPWPVAAIRLLVHDSHIETVHYPLAKPLPRGVGHTPLASHALCP